MGVRQRVLIIIKGFKVRSLALGNTMSVQLISMVDLHCLIHS